ncbi:GntR family transcriptional regulator [Alkalilacustris brevis]|uniref:GntR family transcriptional regulator n=1 Tax=Alkalilacustris brevis TaxID=2026338 RepID=UPI000E0D01CE|nr:GntR family transcriptional regulator [Alkalilacustris brevis]
MATLPWGKRQRDATDTESEAAEGAGLAVVQPAAPTRQPLYRQVKQHLVRRVLAGNWKPGELLPSEIKLAEEYGLSQGTVRKAIEEMAQEGLVARQAGRGTFVTSHSGDYRPFRFHRLCSDDGCKIAGSEVDFLHIRNAPLPKRAALALGLAPGSAGVETLRLRPLDGRPVLVEHICLPEKLCPGIRPRLAEAKPPSVYLFLEQHYNILITGVEERIRARLASAEEARLLGLSPAAPVLEVERVAYSLGGEPVEWRTMTGDAARVFYSSESG